MIFSLIGLLLSFGFIVLSWYSADLSSVWDQLPTDVFTDIAVFGCFVAFSCFNLGNLFFNFFLFLKRKKCLDAIKHIILERTGDRAGSQ